MVRKQQLQNLYWELGRRIRFTVDRFHAHLPHGYDYEDTGLVSCTSFYISRAIKLHNLREKVYARLNGEILQSSEDVDITGLYLAAA